MTVAWTMSDTWILIAGAMCASACALLGNFLILRRMSMMGDAISHAVLPGLVVAFLLADSRAIVPMFVGAAVVGLLTAVFTEWVSGLGKVDENASMGVVFTAMFALGLVLIVQFANDVDLDVDCVLNGAIEYTAMDMLNVAGCDIPRAVVVLSIVLLLDVAVVVVFFKELRISSFDPALATTLGINARVMHYVLMTLVAVTTVAAFESVGSILVVAMLIVPGATARLLTDRLRPMVVLSVIVGIAGAVLGNISVVTLPDLIGVRGVSTAGMMAMASGLIFVIVMMVAPRQGVLSQMLRRAALTLQIVREDVMGLMYRLDELARAGHPDAGHHGQDVIRRSLRLGSVTGWLAYWGLRRRGLIARGEGGYRLTASGRDAAREVVRSHRLWETYLAEYLNLPSDHLHDTAAKLEHLSEDHLRDRLSEATQNPTTDPHGRALPK